MLRFKSFAIASVIIIGCLSVSLRGKKPNLSEAVALMGQIYISDVQHFDSTLKEYPKFFYDSSYEVRIAKNDELVWRYKKLEWLFTYLHPKEAYQTFLQPFQHKKRDNSPAQLPDNFVVFGGLGLETDSFLKVRPQAIGNRSAVIRTCVPVFIKVVEQLNHSKDIQSLTAADVFEALRLSLMKLSTADLGSSMISIRATVFSCSETIKIFLDQLPESEKTLKKNFSNLLVAANKLVSGQKDELIKFNWAQFLTSCLFPFSDYLQDLRKALEVETPHKFAAIRQDASNVYEENAFNVDYFAPSKEAYLTSIKAEVGKLLFFDPVLSDNNKRACASCHKPELAFTDGLLKSVRFDRNELPRNSPTVINSAFQKQVFWDLRANSLEDQLDSVINNENELHSSFANVINRINSSKEYKKLFRKAFPETKRTGIQREHVKIAIACYERTLTGLNSRFDQYMRGDNTRLNEDEIAGFNLFVGKALCGNCHIPPLFNGTLPPYFDITDHRSLGVPLKDTMKSMELDPDTGASKTFQNPFFKFSFKTPTVRNVELTAPYMHNGVYKTLSQVVEFYNHAGGTKFLADFPELKSQLPYNFFTLPPVNLELNEKEKNQLVAFMKSLTDTTAIKNVPKRLPELGGKYAALNSRKIGGEY
jgi:cytochrome c peroxidase